MASDWADERKAIESYFLTNWANATPCKTENDSSFIQPGTQNRVRVPWVGLYIRNAAGGRASIGTPSLHRYIGTIFTQIFTDIGIGTETGRQLASNVADLWRDVTLTAGTNGRIFIGGHHDGTFDTEPRISVIGDDKSGWFQINVTVRFRRDEIF